METNPYEPPETKNTVQGPSTGHRIFVGCAIAALVSLALFIAFFTVCSIVFFSS
jgi:hypothetical protein